MKRMWVLCIAAIMNYAPTALAVPQLINYQGSLASPDGTPLDTTVGITFTIYNAAVGGSALWTETHPAVSVENGLFHVPLGFLMPIEDIFSLTAYLGIAVGGDTEMTPRQQIVSVAHAYRVGTVDGASGGTISGKLNVGSGNTNAGNFANVHGENSVAIGDHATVGGGKHNFARGDYSIIAGGGSPSISDSNAASGIAATISGGQANIASASGSTVAGGTRNIASGSRAAVGGGRLNKASGDYSVVAGGGGASSADSNFATGAASVVSGGRANTASNSWAAVGGGRDNSASGQYSTVSGGDTNSATGPNSTVIGGYRNIASGYGSMAGGASNASSGLWSLAAGAGNAASGDYSVAAGFDNQASDQAAVALGESNSAHEPGSVALGIGNYSGAVFGSSTGTVAIGTECVARGDNSVALGYRAAILEEQEGSFVFADNSTTSYCYANEPQSVNFRAANGYRLYTSSDETWGVWMGASDNAWNSISDSTRKRNRRNVDTKEILEKLTAIPIQQWSYKSQDESIEHIGPMAQDFWNAFHLGHGDTTISTLDPDGVALAAIQELAKEVARLQARVQTLEAEKQETMNMNHRKEQ